LLFGHFCRLYFFFLMFPQKGSERLPARELRLGRADVGKLSRDRVSPADQFAFLFVFGTVDLTTGKTLIENSKRSVSSRTGRPIRYPDNNRSQCD
jgi:hypothetical protein